MSKSGNVKFRWYDEEDEGFYTRDGKRRKNKKDTERRNEKRQKNAIKTKDLNYFYNDEEF